MSASFETVYIVDTGDNELLLMDISDRSLWESRFWSKKKNPRGQGENIYFQSNGKLFHRELLGIKERLDVDHKDGNGLNCCKRNLRLATKTQTSRNSKKTSLVTTSKFKGVTFNKVSNNWKVTIGHVRRKSLHLGYFENELEAAKAYDEAARLYHKEFACVNFPKDNERGALN